MEIIFLIKTHIKYLEIYISEFQHIIWSEEGEGTGRNKNRRETFGSEDERQKDVADLMYTQTNKLKRSCTTKSTIIFCQATKNKFAQMMNCAKMQINNH